MIYGRFYDSRRFMECMTVDLPRHLALYALRVTKVTPHYPALCYHSSHAGMPLVRIFLIRTCEGGTGCAFAAHINPSKATLREYQKRVSLCNCVTLRQVPRLKPRGNTGMFQNNGRYSSRASRAFSAIQSCILTIMRGPTHTEHLAGQISGQSRIGR